MQRCLTDWKPHLTAGTRQIFIGMENKFALFSSDNLQKNFIASPELSTHLIRGNSTIWHCYSYHESICNYSITHSLSPVPVKPVRTPWTVNWIWNANKIMSRRSVLHKRWYEDLNPIYFLAVVLFVKIEKILLCTWTLPRLLQCL